MYILFATDCVASCQCICDCVYDCIGCDVYIDDGKRQYRLHMHLYSNTARPTTANVRIEREKEYGYQTR